MNKQLYLTRTIEEIITEASEYFSVISVTGPRQSGKSTLLKHLFPDVPKYSLKDVNVREFAENDPVAFLRQHPKGMFIDEVQKVPQLLEYIQGIVDDNPGTQYLLTGSSNFELLSHLSESLPGRAGVFELLPMTYAETASTVSQILSMNFSTAVSIPQSARGNTSLDFSTPHTSKPIWSAMYTTF